MADGNDAAEVADEVIDAPEGAEVQDEQLSDVEALAADMGWTPKARWQGDEAQWKPATEFIKATRDINRGLSRDLKDLRRQMEGVSRATASMTERAVQQERERWEAEHDRAVDEGDKDAARAARQNLARLDKQEAPPADPEGQKFAEKHAAWFGKDREATEYAVKRAGYYADQGLSSARQLAAVERDMRATFPDLIGSEEQPRKAPPAVGTPQRTARPAAREKGYATLPPEARKACDAWVERNGHRGKGFGKDDWAKSYYEEQEA